MTLDGAPRTLDILVVDDNEDDVLLLEESFRDQPAVNVIFVVHDGDEALAFLRREGTFANAPRPGLVLLDINMPRKNGFEVLTEMKQDVRLRTIPVVILTTSDRDADVVSAYDCGACSFISKPVNFDRLKQLAELFVRYWSTVARIPKSEN